MSEKQILGLHHMTAITGDAQQNVDFYTGVLGLRLVKLTVNFDDPGAYHLYFGDGAGRPGTILTTFPYPSDATGRRGRGQVTTTALAIPEGAEGFWQERIAGQGVEVDSTLAFVAPDGLRYQFVPVPPLDQPATWDGAPVSPDKAIARMHSVQITQSNATPTIKTLVEDMGFRVHEQLGQTTRLTAGDGGPGAFVDVIEDVNAPASRGGMGAVHHIAFRVADEPTQGEWLSDLRSKGYHVSPVMDRDYFRSIYFREPGGVLFEIATDPPGFTADESIELLGTGLKLPRQYEPLRARIEATLPKLRLPGGTMVGV